MDEFYVVELGFVNEGPIATYVFTDPGQARAKALDLRALNSSERYWVAVTGPCEVGVDFRDNGFPEELF